ncbi:unnamed protein product [Pleuronectes platessa]|uniref:Uncharacterized protein n=1 Tax=Pleuronectes platessa TaxID=8262 RepID=A0A9N7VSN2_PLEPL|nr:unnamed protein product [Pleuronectes platessa]
MWRKEKKPALNRDGDVEKEMTMASKRKNRWREREEEEERGGTEQQSGVDGGYPAESAVRMGFTPRRVKIHGSDMWPDISERYFLNVLLPVLSLRSLTSIHPATVYTDKPLKHGALSS